MDRVYEVSGRVLAAIFLAAISINYVVGYSVWQWVLILRGLM